MAASGAVSKHGPLDATSSFACLRLWVQRHVLCSLGWAVRLSELPLVARLVEIVYDFLSANRQQLSMYMPSWMDGK